MKAGIPSEKVFRYAYEFGANTTDEKMLEMSNYGEIFHNHRSY